MVLLAALLFVAVSGVGIIVSGAAESEYEWGLILAFLIAGPAFWLLCGGVLGSAELGFVTSVPLTILFGYALIELFP